MYNLESPHCAHPHNAPRQSFIPNARAFHLPYDPFLILFLLHSKDVYNTHKISDDSEFFYTTLCLFVWGDFDYILRNQLFTGILKIETVFEI